MDFRPQIPLTGIAGWRFLERTQASQQAAFEKGAELVRETKYFADKIGSVATAEDVVADRRLLKIALGAFGLEGELDKRAYIRKVLEEGTEAPGAFATRLSEPAYRKLADAFGFGNARGARTGDAGFAEKIISAYKTRAFEAAVGESDESMRFAMNFRREIAELASRPQGGSWFSVLGSKPLRKVLEGAFNLPAQFGKLDVDKQREILRDKAGAMFGVSDLSAFRDPANVQKVIDRFLIRAQIDEGPAAGTRGLTALTLLQNASASGSLGWSNLLAARS